MSNPVILLVDNGSLEPAAILSLRAVAARLGAAAGRPVEPVSMLHSSAVSPDLLEGVPAEILEPALERRLRGGAEEFLIVPLFFGPSLALADYLPKRVGALRERFPVLKVRVAAPLVEAGDKGDDRLAAILEQRVRAAMPGLEGKPAVILVDHGSPARGVVAVRDHLAVQLRARLGASVRGLAAASMERRPGPEYAFGDPLLENAFDVPGYDRGTVVVVRLFFSPGRHAGAGGDIDGICRAAAARHPGLVIRQTELIGSHEGLVPILVDRLRAGLKSDPI